MRKTVVKLAGKLLTLALLVGCLSVIAPGRAAKAGWIDCLADWGYCEYQCGDPTAVGYDECLDLCDQTLFICEVNSPPDDGGFKIWP